MTGQKYDRHVGQPVNLLICNQEYSNIMPLDTYLLPRDKSALCHGGASCVVFDLDTAVFGANNKSRELTLSITAIAGRGLKAMDYNGLSDPYITFQVGSSRRTVKTKVIDQNLNPKWNEKLELSVPLHDIKQKQQLCIRVMDEDTMSKDDLIGTVQVPLASIVSQSQKYLESPNLGLDVEHPPTWFTIADEKGMKTGEISLHLKFDDKELALLVEQHLELCASPCSAITVSASVKITVCVCGRGCVRLLACVCMCWVRQIINAI